MDIKSSAQHTHLLLRLKQSLQVRDYLSFEVLGPLFLQGRTTNVASQTVRTSRTTSECDGGMAGGGGTNLKADDFLPHRGGNPFEVSLVLRDLGFPL